MIKKRNSLYFLIFCATFNKAYAGEIWSKVSRLPAEVQQSVYRYALSGLLPYYAESLCIDTKAFQAIMAVCFNHNGTHIAYSDDDSISRWDIESGQPLPPFIGHTHKVNSLCFNHDSTQAASGSYDKSVRLWDTTTSEQLKQFIGHNKLVACVCFNHDSTQIASGSFDNTIRLWDPETGQQLQQFIGHANEVNSVCFNHDGTQIVSGSADKTIRLWENLQIPLRQGIRNNDNVQNQLVAYLSVYKKYLQHYHPKVDYVSFSGLAKFLNQRDAVGKVAAQDLQAIYQSMDPNLKKALYTIFCSRYKTT